MGQTIACANQKGGVGKTTTVVNLGSYLALAGERVLVVDLDPQGNATSGLGLDRNSIERSVYDAVIDGAEHPRPDRAGPDRRVSMSSRRPIALAGAEVELAPVEGRERRLGTAARRDRRRLRLHPHRLPAVARTADRQRPDRRRLRADPAAMRVLRPGRTDPAACHARSRSRPPEPRARHQGRRPDDVRRPDEPVRRCRGRGRGATSATASSTTVIPRNVRLSEAPSHGLPIAALLPRIRPARSRTPPSRPSCARRDGRAPTAACTERRDADGGRHDRPTRALAGPRARSGLAHPAAQPGPAGVDRDRDRRGSRRTRTSRASGSTPRASRR